MGTRYEDQPADHWAGPESLDPTPVWKQYVLVALLLFGGLIVVLVVSLLAILPQLVTPPALVPGDRLVLKIEDTRAARAVPQRIGAPLIDDSRSFWLTRMAPGNFYAFPTRWSPRAGERECSVEIDPASRTPNSPPGFVAVCGPASNTYHFSASGSFSITTPRESGRDLDQYLVSVSDDRVIVNLSRLVRASEKTTAPVPTGIPQPQQR
jgi:hypothetical protein